MSREPGIPESGSVLGIDVGYSKSKKTTAIAFLTWDAHSISWRVDVIGSDWGDRRKKLQEMVPRGSCLDAVAIDGPLASTLGVVSGYRCADALCSRGLFQTRGSAAPSSPISPLHIHATKLARLALDLEGSRYWSIGKATHPELIHEKRIVEAHPVPFLSTLIDENALPTVKRGSASDDFYKNLVASGKLEHVLMEILPHRKQNLTLNKIVHHDERAAVACALTGLCLLAGCYLAVGDPSDGFIVLTSQDQWGSSNTGGPHRSWAERELCSNLSSLRKEAARPTPKPRFSQNATVSSNGHAVL